MSDSRLFRQFQPTHYMLNITLERQKRRFQGTVTIAGMTARGSQAIRLHAHKLHILDANIDGLPATFEYGEHDSLKVAAPNLTPGQHTVTLAFEGKITNPMHGLYPCYFKLDDQDEELLATQFESHHAREVFPCVDEPEAKATFDLTLTTEAGVNVVSNTPIKEQHEQGDALVTSFETTPRMSTYLLAWVVGKLDWREATTKDGVIVRTYATRGKGDQLGYSLKAAVECLELFNDYFNVPYPLPKCDLIALPDFSSGAMENWGCITFRETVMLADQHSSTRTRQFIVMVIAHELAHQWFGDLVTMRWWNDLWLNESFANWMEYFIPSKLRPEWQLMTQYFDDETARAIARDSLASVQKIQQEVRLAEEIPTLFDPAIVYAKGGSLINMLHAHLGPELFRKGLTLYFDRHKYTNTEADDLWKAWAEVSGKDIVSFMQPWIAQPGLPVVTVGLADDTVNIYQHRFYSNPKEAPQNDQTLWPIPLLATGQLDLDVLDQRNSALSLNPGDRPLLLNQGRTGYYLTMYDQEHLARLAAEVRAGRMNTLDRLGLLTDSLRLSEAGLQSYLTALGLLESYREESNYAVWGAISNHFEALKMFVDSDDPLHTALKEYIRNICTRQMTRLGWEPTQGESQFDSLLRPLIIGHLAYAEDEKAVTRLRTMFDQASEPGAIWADIRAITCAVAAKYGNDSTFDKLLGWHNNTRSAEQRTQVIAGLCSFRDLPMITRSLELLTTDAVRLQDLFYWLVYLSRNHYAYEAMWQWMKNNWQWIADHFSNDMHYADFPKYAAASFSTPEHLASYKQFFGPMQNDVGLSRAIAQGTEDIERRILWRERDGQAVAGYLQSYAPTTI